MYTHPQDTKCTLGNARGRSSLAPHGLQGSPHRSVGLSVCGQALTCRRRSLVLLLLLGPRLGHGERPRPQRQGAGEASPPGERLTEVPPWNRLSPGSQHRPLSRAPLARSPSERAGEVAGAGSWASRQDARFQAGARSAARPLGRPPHVAQPQGCRQHVVLVSLVPAAPSSPSASGWPGWGSQPVAPRSSACSQVTSSTTNPATRPQGAWLPHAAPGAMMTRLPCAASPMPTKLLSEASHAPCQIMTF